MTPAWREARRLTRETLSDAAKPVGEGHDPLAPLPEQVDPECFWCGARHHLRVGRLPGLGYGTYCERCGRDGSGRE